MKSIKWVMLILMVSIMVTGYGGMCKKDSNSGSSAPVEEFPLGLKLLPSSTYNSIPMALPPLMGEGDLPTQVDLSSNMPTPGNQGGQGSCVGWAVAYALKTYQERVERSWSLTTNIHLFSPAYIYNQLNGGIDRGAYFYDAFNILTSQGCASLATMSYNQNDYLTQPSSTARTEATQYKASVWRTINYWDRTEVKKWLYSGNALPIAILVGGNFGYSNMRNNNYIYSSLGEKRPDMNGNLSYPGHAVVLCGYNDSKSAFKIINSWGTTWADNGYGWIDYNFFPEVCYEAYCVQDEIEGEMVSTSNRPSGPPSGNTGTSYSYSTGGSSSSLGHTVEYQFDWKGDGTDLSPWGSATQSKTQTSADTYSVKAHARCIADTSVISVWSPGFEVIISAVPPTETVSTPNQPTGQTSGNTGTSYSYSTGGSTSNLGHSIEYRFDWGDGSYSNWSSSSKTWFSANTYTVKAQARCATDTSVVSDWSSGLSVSIVAAPTWQISTVDSSGDTGLYSDIAIDSNNKIHISYHDATNANLNYYKDGSYWILDSVGLVGLYTSIAIDSNNKVHISYYDDTNNTLKYATNASGGWVYTTVDDGTGGTVHVGKRTSIALDSNNKVHIAYQDYTNTALKYATNASGSWVKTTVDTDNAGWSTSIAVDSNNKAHIFYSAQASPSAQRYATNASGSWVKTTIDTNDIGVTTDSGSIAIDSNNKVHISYVGASSNLFYATNVSGSWVLTNVDSTGSCRYTSIALDSNNKVHISYRYATSLDLKYATNVSGSWVLDTVDSTGDVGWYNSIAIDSNNKVHISYYDATNFDLKYATNN